MREELSSQEGHSEEQCQRQSLQNSGPELQPLPLEPELIGWGSWEPGRAYFPIGGSVPGPTLGSHCLAPTVTYLGVLKWRHVHYGLTQLLSSTHQP